MPCVYAAPIFYRQGVIAGFTLVPAAGLIPGITKGALRRQGVLYRPAGAPVLPPAPDDARSYLFYGQAGFYWNADGTPSSAADAYLGWVVTSGGQVIRTCAQRITVSEEGSTTTVMGTGPQQRDPSADDPAGILPETPRVTYDRAARRAIVTIPFAWPSPAGDMIGVDAGLDAPDSAPHVGVVNTNGTAVARIAGDAFNLNWPAGYPISIGGNEFLIASVESGDALTLSSSAGVQNLVKYTCGEPLELDQAELGVGELLTDFSLEARAYVPLTADDADGVIVLKHAIPKRSERWRVYFSTETKTGKQKIVRRGETGETPNVDFWVDPLGEAGSGVEWAPLVKSITAAWSYGLNADGQRVAWLKGTITRPDDLSLYGGFVVQARKPDGTILNLTGTETGVSWQWETGEFPTASEEWDVWALSVDRENNRNSYVGGVTPTVKVMVGPPPAGSVGQEYADLVVPAVTFVTIDHWSDSADGSYLGRVVANFTAPSDPRFGGVEVQVIDAAGKIADVRRFRSGPTENWISEPSTVQTWWVRVFSLDVNGKRNTYVNGVTPEQAITVGSASGRNDLSKAYNFGADFKVEGGVFKINALSANYITSGVLDVKPTGNGKCTMFRVFDGLNSLIVFAGDNTADASPDWRFHGLWAKVGRFGGPDPAHPIIALTSSGATIDGATVRVQESGGAVVTLDATYGFQSLLGGLVTSVRGATFFQGFTSQGGADPRTAYQQASWLEPSSFRLTGPSAALRFNLTTNINGTYVLIGDNYAVQRHEINSGKTDQYGTIVSQPFADFYELRTGGTTRITNSGALCAASAAWNGAHLKLGTYELWIDANGRLRVKNGAPANDTDGTIVGSQS